jgi:uncharacterized protein YndB with AHSA1/START domain
VPTVRREVVLPVAPERAWELLTDPAELEGWLADEVVLDPEPGGEVCAEWEGGERLEGVVEEVDPERRLAFRWGDSRVEWTLDAVAGGTRLRVVEHSLMPVVGPRMAALSAHAALCPA